MVLGIGDATGVISGHEKMSRQETKDFPVAVMSQEESHLKIVVRRTDRRTFYTMVLSGVLGNPAAFKLWCTVFARACSESNTPPSFHHSPDYGYVDPHVHI
ncbi:hypothetical protein J6590_005569 [Homalodisca vitripennis]|nr:hypothetical protein J6590_005569 [Homalodisca vitripennis]